MELLVLVEIRTYISIRQYILMLWSHTKCNTNRISSIPDFYPLTVKEKPWVAFKSIRIETTLLMYADSFSVSTPGSSVKKTSPGPCQKARLGYDSE